MNSERLINYIALHEDFPREFRCDGLVSRRSEFKLVSFEMRKISCFGVFVAVPIRR